MPLSRRLRSVIILTPLSLASAQRPPQQKLIHTCPTAIAPYTSSFRDRHWSTPFPLPHDKGAEY